MPSLRIGILGYGAFGRFLHDAWRTLDDVRVVAVAAQEPVAPEAGVRAFKRWEDLVASGEIDLAVVALPPDAHGRAAVAALDAGLHVLVEKPLATTLEDAGAIRAAAQRAERAHGPRVVGVDFLMRFNPVVEALHAWCRPDVETGAGPDARPFGVLRRVVVENYAQDESLGPEHWFWDRARSGGILVEHAVHFIDVVNGCGPGAPARVQGAAVRRADGREDRVLVNVLYESGLAMTQYHAFSRPNFFEETTLRFVFDLAELRWEGWIPMRGTVRALIGPETEAALHLLPGYAEHVRAAVPAGRGGPLRSGGVAYAPTHDVSGAFALPGSKADAYADAVRALLLDVRRAIETPGYRVRAGLGEGTESLRIALAAANDGAAVAERA